MARSFMPKIRTERELKRIQLEGLQWTVSHVHKNSDFYRERFDELGIKWANMFARCYEMAGLSTRDRVQIAVGYGVWTAGVGFQLGCERLGAMAVPIGPGNVDMQCQFLEDFQSTVLCFTASMGILMAEEVEQNWDTSHIY